MQNYDIEVVEDTKEDDDDTSLDIRNESGESYEDMVSILPSEPVKMFRIKCTNGILSFLEWSKFCINTTTWPVGRIDKWREYLQWENGYWWAEN